ncbi:hypothetical protein [Polyangium sp. y55x31]|uniref:hypothetical protein n=1 Tax=Polyangium sp. y55x31 TaxID=3042688 RepID=UPI002482B543|nr:hypothetical protein [Polyangium sp. y55x31]MDI1484505.1 hypothetical protein [Polyangium sp. y55x31]
MALIGYSAGLQSWPPEEWQIGWLRDIANEARAGRALLVATHTQQGYTERLPRGKAFCSTARVLRMATGWPLNRAGPLDAPVVTSEGALYVYSYASADIDASARAAQLVRVVPELRARHLGPWFAEQGRLKPAARSLVPLGLLGFAAFILASPPRT